jgi:hypothetical protein
MSVISITELSTGEQVGLCTIEITSIPHASILKKRYQNIANIDIEYKQDMARLLSELYQGYKSTTNICGDISFELLWITQGVANQPFNASISIYLIVRAIGSSVIDVEEIISSLNDRLS